MALPKALLETKMKSLVFTHLEALDLCLGQLLEDVCMGAWVHGGMGAQWHLSVSRAGTSPILPISAATGSLLGLPTKGGRFAYI